MDLIKEAIKNLLLDALSSFDEMVANAIGILSGSDTTLIDADAVWANVVAINDVLKPFCLIVIGICVLIELAQVAAKVDIMKWEHGLRIAVKLCLARVIVDNIATFLEACYAQAAEWAGAVGTDITSMSESYTDLITDTCNEITGFWQPLLAMMTLLIPCMAIKICGLLIEVMAFGRMFEMFVLLAVAPLPCAFFPLGDGSGGGFSRITKKYIVNFVGVCLQGVMILVCLRVFGIILDSFIVGLEESELDAITKVSNLSYQILLGAIVLVMACAKTSSWAKSILDAG